MDKMAEMVHADVVALGALLRAPSCWGSTAGKQVRRIAAIATAVTIATVGTSCTSGSDGIDAYTEAIAHCDHLHGV